MNVKTGSPYSSRSSDSLVITAEPEVVVAPYADCTGFGKEINSLFQMVSQLEQVTEEHEAVGPLVTEDINGPP